MRVEPVESLEDPRLAAYRDVRDGDLRERAGLFVVEGRLNVERLLDSRFRPRSVFVTRAGLAGIGPALEKSAPPIPVYLAPQGLMNRVVGYDMHRGCLAVAERGEPLAPRALVGDGAGPRRLLVLEDLTNPENVGGAFRNAWAFGVDGALLTARCVDPLYRKAVRVSMGATLRVPFARVADGAAALAVLHGAGWESVALTTDRAAPALAATDPSAPRLALWLGGEGPGLSPGVLAAIPRRVTIPMAPGVDSLNAATATGIALHHFCPDPGAGEGDA